MKPHKFITNNTNNHYGVISICQYCGAVAFDGNYGGKSDDFYEKNKNGCPCAPDEDIDDLKARIKELEKLVTNPPIILQSTPPNTLT